MSQECTSQIRFSIDFKDEKIPLDEVEVGPFLARLVSELIGVIIATYSSQEEFSISRADASCFESLGNTFILSFVGISLLHLEGVNELVCLFFAKRFSDSKYSFIIPKVNIILLDAEQVRREELLNRGSSVSSVQRSYYNSSSDRLSLFVGGR